MFCASYHYLLGFFENDVAIKMGFCQCSIAHECMTSPKDEAHKHIGILKEGKQYASLHFCFAFLFSIFVFVSIHCIIMNFLMLSSVWGREKIKFQSLYSKLQDSKVFFHFIVVVRFFLCFYHVTFIRVKHKKEERTPKFRINAPRI